jgi:TRAP-type transport system periplasmic protein
LTDEEKNMRRSDRRDFLRGATVAAISTLALPRRASAAEFSFKLGTDLPVTHPVNVHLQDALQKILEESAGKLEIKLFPNNQLGGDTDMLSQLRSGALEMFTLSGNLLSTLVKPTSLYGVAYAFPDYDRVWSALDGDLGAYLRRAIAKAGIHALDKLWDNGFRQITSSTHPIKSPDDLKGFKIRVPVSPMWTSVFKGLGASPTAINFSEVYSALQTRIVDGQENSLQLIDIAKLYEVQKFVSVTNHMWDGFFFLVNGRVWSRLSPQLQDMVARNIDAAAVKERADMLKLNQKVEERLKQHGMTFNRTEPAVFRATLSKSGYYKQWKEAFGNEAWTLLEKYSGTLA